MSSRGTPQGGSSTCPIPFPWQLQVLGAREARSRADACAQSEGQGDSATRDPWGRGVRSWRMRTALLSRWCVLSDHSVTNFLICLPSFLVWHQPVTPFSRVRFPSYMTQKPFSQPLSGGSRLRKRLSVDETTTNTLGEDLGLSQRVGLLDNWMEL